MHELTTDEAEVLAWILEVPDEAVDAEMLGDALGRDAALVAIDLRTLEAASYLIQDEPQRGYYLPLTTAEREAAAG